MDMESFLCMCVALIFFGVWENGGLLILILYTSEFYLFTGAQLSGALPDMTLISKLNRCIQLIRERLSHIVDLL